MAIVYQSDRNLLQRIQQNQKIGPGSYDSTNYYEKKKHKQNNLKKKIDDKQHQIYQNIITPGPGSYEIYQETIQDQHFQIDLNNPSKVVQIPRQQNMFKSKVERFKPEYKSITPGPDYNIQQQKREKSKEERSKTLNVVLELKKSNQYNNPPSIPGSDQKFGYKEFQKKDSFNPLHSLKNQPNFQKQKKIGPTFYKEPKLVAPISQTDEIVGPGSYQLECQNNLQFKKNYNYGFISKSHRLFDQRKGEIANQHISQNWQQRAKQMGDEQLEEIETEYIAESNPGPGYYYSENNSLSFKTIPKVKEAQQFGFKSQRFIEPLQNLVGPASYDVAKSQPIPIGKFQSAFKNQEKRFLKNIPSNNPAPGFYDFQNSIEKINIKKKNMKGGFGSTVEKMINPVEYELNPGPGQYLNPDIICLENYKTVLEGNQSHFFKSNTKREIPLQNIDNHQTEIQYDVNNFTINQQTKKKQKDNQKLVFFQGEQKKQNVENITKQQKTINKTNFTEFLLKEKKYSYPFNTDDEKCKKVNLQNEVGPGYYDPNNKILVGSFNILFQKY